MQQALDLPDHALPRRKPVALEFLFRSPLAALAPLLLVPLFILFGW